MFFPVLCKAYKVRSKTESSPTLGVTLAVPDALLPIFPHLGIFHEYPTVPIHSTPCLSQGKHFLSVIPSSQFLGCWEVSQTKETNDMQLLLLPVPRTGSAHWCLKKKHIAKALCFQWQDGWEKCQPLAITLLSCQLLALWGCTLDTSLEKSSASHPSRWRRNDSYTHKHARMMAEEKTFSLCFLFCITGILRALITAKNWTDDDDTSCPRECLC